MVFSYSLNTYTQYFLKLTKNIDSGVGGYESYDAQIVKVRKAQKSY
jgi:hypothetical protein